MDYVDLGQKTHAFHNMAKLILQFGLTLCSSCFTSRTVPSLKVHLTTSVSFWDSTYSLLFSALQKFLKSWTEGVD